MFSHAQAEDNDLPRAFKEQDPVAPVTDQPIFDRSRADWMTP
jgi:hypothetical protein